MKTLVKALIRWAYGFDIGTIAQYNLKVVDELPETTEDKTIYFIKEDTK